MLWFFLAASYSVKGTMDLHIQSGFVYYIDNSTYTSYKGIYRTKTSGEFTTRLISSGIGKLGIQGLAVDWIAGMIVPCPLLPLPLGVILGNLFCLKTPGIEKQTCLSVSVFIFIISQIKNHYYFCR